MKQAVRKKTTGHRTQSIGQSEDPFNTPNEKRWSGFLHSYRNCYLPAKQTYNRQRITGNSNTEIKIQQNNAIEAV